MEEEIPKIASLGKSVFWQYIASWISSPHIMFNNIIIQIITNGYRQTILIIFISSYYYFLNAYAIHTQNHR